MKRKKKQRVKRKREIEKISIIYNKVMAKVRKYTLATFCNNKG